MSNHLIPLPSDLSFWRSRLFSLFEPVVLSQYEHATYWQWIDNIYSFQGSETQRTTGEYVLYGECRLVKSRISNTRAVTKVGTKRRCTGEHMPDQCSVRVRLERKVSLDGMITYILSRYAGSGQRGLVSQEEAPLHSHTLDDSDRRKRNSGIKSLVIKQLLNHVDPGQIRKNLFGNGIYDGDVRIVEAGGRYLETKEIINIRASKAVREQLNVVDQRVLKASISWDEDLTRCMDFLSENGYLMEKIHADIDIPRDRRIPGSMATTRSCFGLVFAKEERLRYLATHGTLTLFDSTHGTNKHGFNLFTFMVRDSFGTWIPAAFALLETETGKLIAKALQAVRAWTGDRWAPKFIITDDSASEQLGVRLAFEGTDLQVCDTGPGLFCDCFKLVAIY